MSLKAHIPKGKRPEMKLTRIKLSSQHSCVSLTTCLLAFVPGSPSRSLILKLCEKWKILNY